MRERVNRKSLAVKVSEDFYNNCKKYAHENYMTISDLLRNALYEAYGLEETDAAEPKDDE